LELDRVKLNPSLQAGAFQNAPDADNLKARLALLGVEATIQTTTLPGKGVRHRVRVGPYIAIEDLNRARDALKQNGIETTLIKVRAAPVQSAK
jgi:cell division protein FtsN